MSEAISNRILKLRVLSEVPRSEYSEIQAPRNVPDEEERGLFFRLLRKGSQTKTDTQKVAQAVPRRALRFNAAAWITFRNTPSKPVSLWLNYKDEQGVKSVLVDETRPQEKGSLMLSGMADIKVKGELLYIHACVGGLGDDDIFRVDELYVQRAETTAATTRRHSA